MNERFEYTEIESYEDVMKADRAAREYVKNIVEK